MKLKRQYIFTVLLIVVLLVATALRLWRLTEFPPGITGDEAANGMEIIQLLDNPHITVFFPENTGREALFFYLSSLSFVILGPTLFALRIVSVLAGILLIPLSYRWVKILIPKSKQRGWIALITAILIATSPWALYNSRIGLRGGLLPLFMLAVYLFFWRGYLSRQTKWFIITGLFLGVSAYTYTSSRLLPLTFVVFGLCLTIFYRSQERGRLGSSWKGIVIVGLVALIVFVPLGWYFVNHPDTFLFRTRQVSLLSEYKREVNSTDESLLLYLFSNWEKFTRFFIQLSTPWIQNQTWPLILRALPLLFWIGLFRAVYLARRQVAYTFLLISFFVGMLPLIYTFPTTLRNSPALPPTYLLMALGAYFLIEILLRRMVILREQIILIIVSVLLFVSALSAVNLFRFENWIVGLTDTPAEGRWVHMAHLPTVATHTINSAAQQIRHMVLNEKQSVLIPYIFYDRAPVKFIFQADFDLSAPVTEKSVIQSSETISILWSPLFENQPKKFLLLSPGATDKIGYLELSGEMQQEELPVFREIVYHQAEPEMVYDIAGQPAGFFVKANREQVLNLLENTTTIPNGP